MRKRVALLSIVTVGIVLAVAAPASAHITVDPLSAPKGSTVKLSFLVPNEEPSATVTEIAIAFPTPPETPIPTVSVEPKAGWTVEVTTQKLTTPIVTDDGSIETVVSQIDWKANTPADGIAADQFQEFTIDADGLPDNESQVVFRAIQTYSDGTVVKWIDPVTEGGPEAEHPTPILQLTDADSGSSTPTTAAAAGSSGGSSKHNSTRTLAIVAALMAAVALVMSGAGLMQRRGRR